jgi:hypothetical protein
MPNEGVTTDYAEGWEAGAKALHEQVCRDLLDAFRAIGDEEPGFKGVLTGIYCLIRGMQMPKVERR